MKGGGNTVTVLPDVTLIRMRNSQEDDPNNPQVEINALADQLSRRGPATRVSDGAAA